MIESRKSEIRFVISRYIPLEFSMVYNDEQK